jgi:hypothetical protein
MPLFVFVLVFQVVSEAVRVFREKARKIKPAPLCAGCLHAHVQYAANARRAISCTYGGVVRRMNLDVFVLHGLSDSKLAGAFSRNRVRARHCSSGVTGRAAPRNYGAAHPF